LHLKRPVRHGFSGNTTALSGNALETAGVDAPRFRHGMTPMEVI
jgi:hypothetical protein